MRQMISRAFFLMVVTPFAFSTESIPPQLVLDKIQFQVSAKQWVATESALLGVTINATLGTADLVKVRSDIMERLNKIAQGDWHIVAFDRSQDSSGLEKLDVHAKARINQASLTDIYKNAKAVSMPGAKYDISSVAFKPSLEETQAVLAKVRAQLYQQVNDEIARMNKAYPTQNYSVSNLVFVSGDTPPMQPLAKGMNAMVMASGVTPALTVSNELILTAVVDAASNRKQ